MFTIENYTIDPVVSFLYNFPLKGKSSRGRTKLIKKLVDKRDEYFEDRKELGDEDPQELDNEKASVDMSEYRELMRALLEGLYESSAELSGQDSLIYDLIVEQLEGQD